MWYIVFMRTTLELDDDLIAMAKELARERASTVGQVISQLARQSLEAAAPPKLRNGVPVFPKAGAGKSSLSIVNKLRDE